jgi:hypothetical protein
MNLINYKFSINIIIININMSYTDEFLENSGQLPRDVIRMLKQVREIDEKCVSIINIIKKL